MKGGATPGWKETFRRRCENEFFYFHLNVMDNDADTAFHKDLCEYLQRVRPHRRRIAVALCARGFLKSTIGNVELNQWRLARDRNAAILVSHAVDDKTVALINEIRMSLRKNEKLHDIWPDVFYKNPDKECGREDRAWSDNAIDVKRDRRDKVPSITGASMNSTQAGFHFTHITIDDWVNDQNYKTPSGIQDPISRFRDLQSNVRNKDICFDVLETVYAHNDLTGWLEEPRNKMADLCDWFVRDPFEVGSPPWTESAWPKEKPIAFLREQEKALGPIQFSQQFLQKRIIAGSNVFDLTTIPRYPQQWVNVRGDHEALVLPGESKDESDEDRRVFKHILTFDARAQYDRALDRACVMVGAWGDEDVEKGRESSWYGCEIRYGHPNLDEFIDWIFDMAATWIPSAVVCEQSGAMRHMKDLVLREQRRRGVTLPWRFVERQNTTKANRIAAVQPYAARGVLNVPEGRAWDDSLLFEMKGYQIHVRNQPDDALDCMADQVQYRDVPRIGKSGVRAKADQDAYARLVFDSVKRRSHTLTRQYAVQGR